MITLKTSMQIKPASFEKFLDGILNLSSVVRCHGHNIINQQSVADHSARVAMLCYAIALEYYNDPVKASSLSTVALFHDFTEGVMRNDMNSSIKSKYGIRELMKKLEKDIVEDIFDDSSETSDLYRNLLLENNISTMDKAIIKISDTLDFGLYLWSEYNLGNKHLTPSFENFKAEYSAYPEELRNLAFCDNCIKKIFSRY